MAFEARKSGDTQQTGPSSAVEQGLRLGRHEDTCGSDIPYKGVQHAAITLIHRFMNFVAPVVQVGVTALILLPPHRRERSLPTPALPQNRPSDLPGTRTGARCG